MICISDEQVWEHYKEAFLSKIDAHLLNIDDIDIAIVKVGAFILLYKS